MAPPPNPQDYVLTIRQQPKFGCVALTKGKDRRPLDPPPIVQLSVNTRADPIQKYLQNPYFMMIARLVSRSNINEDPQEKQRSEVKPVDLAGTIVSSLYNLKDINNQQGGFFVFGDLSVKKEGTFRLEFTLFEMRAKDCYLISTEISDDFIVYPSKTFPGLAESTFLTRTFSDQGVRLRLRKDSRTVVSRKRQASNAQQTDHTKPQSMGGYVAQQENGTHDLSPQSQSPHHFSRRQSVPDGQYENSYDFSSYERPNKRIRQHSGGGHTSYDPGYHTYPNPSPRTLPDNMVPYPAPMTSSYHMSPQQTSTLPPMPPTMATFAPRIDTQLPSIPGPSSASSSTFSPGTRRSPGSGYGHYQAAPNPSIHMSPMHMFPPTTYMSHHTSDSATLPNLSNLPALDVESKS
ncbi:velvet factor-domain-containing protein [Podospora fimiseda]|uniref:Velvet factor-domain-containing protein n=1 Tax=Podospora fimiseda TaxID=252190 RepID=A0AAN7BZI4_9PEZI|nr:velvet factor-domain-containing protein [Podospora fimiseda]